MKRDLFDKILRLADMAQDLAATIPEGVGHHTPCAVDALVAEILADLDPKQEEAPRPWRWEGDVLYVGDQSAGCIVYSGGLLYLAAPGRTMVMPDERTARAVAVALAGYDPGVTFVLSLRPDWTREDIDAARNVDLSDYIAPMLEGWAGDFDGRQHTEDPQVVRVWWAGGYKALNLQAKDRDDDCPF